MFIYSIRDLLAKEFGPPFVAKNDEVALRHFANFIRTNPTVPEADMRLHRLASWDDEKGISNPENEIVTGG